MKITLDIIPSNTKSFGTIITTDGHIGTETPGIDP